MASNACLSVSFPPPRINPFLSMVEAMELQEQTRASASRLESKYDEVNFTSIVKICESSI